MDELQPERESLSQNASELLDAWLRSQEFAAEPEAPDVDSLVAYQSGALSAEARRSVERGLTLHPSARSLLRSTREALRRLRALPWSEVTSQSQADDLNGQTARAWLTLTTGAVASAPSAQTWWQSQGWSAIHRQMASGMTEARAAWANFLSFGEQLRVAFRQAGPAVARGRSDTPVCLCGEMPPGIKLTLSTDVDAEGLLTSTLYVLDPVGNPSLLLAGAPVQLLFLVNGQTWPLAYAEIGEDRAYWSLPALGTTLGLAAGPLPADYFCVALQDAPALLTDSVLPLFAEVLDRVGKPTTDSPLRLEFCSEPRWDAGKFRLELALPAEVRGRYDAYQLRLDVVVFGTSRQCLGYWPIRDWSIESRLLVADCPGSPDATVPYASVLHATLQPLATG